MAGNSCVVQIQFCALRVARVNASNGLTPAGLTNGYITDQQIRLEMALETEDGQEFNVKNGCDALKLSTSASRKLRYGRVTLALTGPDPELQELLTNGSLITVGGNSEGYAWPQVGVENTDFVSLEGWAKAFDGSTPATKPYIRYVLPKVRLFPADRTLENEPAEIVFEGEAFENAAWADGPFEDWPAATFPGRIIQHVLDTTLPTPACGFTEVPVQAGGS